MKKLTMVMAVLAFVGIARANIPKNRIIKIKTSQSPQRIVATSPLTTRTERSDVNVVKGVKQEGDSLYFYNSVNYVAIGLWGGGVYQAAIKLTSDELSQYANYRIDKVYFYHHDRAIHYGRVIIYGAGTSRSPGDTITIQEYVTYDSGWISVTLPTVVRIDGTSDIWVSVEIEHNEGEHPISVDAGPAVATKGDWIYTGNNWHELLDYGSSYSWNWNIGVVVEPWGDLLDPLPPSDITLYSDYTTPSEINLSWSDPEYYVRGDDLTNFHIEVWISSQNEKDSTLLDTIPAGVERYTATGLMDGELYRFYLRAVDENDSTSVFVWRSWYAGGSPYPAPPENLTATILNDSMVELAWINPSTQSDGTPLDDLAGINIYIDDSLLETYATNDTGAFITRDVIVPHGRHSFYVKAIDNESPQHESEPSNSIDVAADAHAGGPDGYGYTFVDSDHPEGVDFIWVDASIGTPHVLGDDDNELIYLPFAFPFYDRALTQIYLVSNGFLTSTNTTHFSDSFPDHDRNNIISPFRDNLDPSRGGTIYTYYDMEGTGAFVIEWKNVLHYHSGGPYTFEILLYPSGDIAFSYLDVNRPFALSTIGIQGGDGSNGYYIQYTSNGYPIIPHDSMIVLFRRPRAQHDVGVVSVIEPLGQYDVGDTVCPAVLVSNFGQSPEILDVIALITTTDTIYEDTVSVSVTPESQTEVIFTPYIITSEGSYTFTAYTVLPEDENPDNDTLIAYFYIFNYIENFENTNGSFIAVPATNAWEWGVPSFGPDGAHSGINVWGTVLAGEYTNNANWELYSPPYLAIVDTPVIAFWHWYYMENYYDGGNVAISTDSGQTWTLLTPLSNYPESNVFGLGEPGFTGISNDWELAAFCLHGVTAGTIFRLRFRFASDSSITHAGWYIDDLSGAGIISAIKESPVHDKLSFNLLGSSVNPVSSVTNVMFSVPRRTTVKIELYDVAGRRLTTLADGEFDAGMHTIKLDVSQLANGVYFLRMISGNFEDTQKLIVVNKR